MALTVIQYTNTYIYLNSFLDISVVCTCRVLFPIKISIQSNFIIKYTTNLNAHLDARK